MVEVLALSKGAKLVTWPLPPLTVTYKILPYAGGIKDLIQV